MWTSLLSLDRLSGVRFANAGNPNSMRIDIHDPSTWEGLVGAVSDSGEHVTPDVALSLPSFWQGVNKISGDIASLPLHLYRKDANDDRHIDSEHRAEQAVSEPNEETHAFEFWRRINAHAIIWGNGYAFIDGIFQPDAPLRLYNLLPDRTTVKFIKDRAGRVQMYYVTEVGGTLEYMLPREVLHLKGLSLQSGVGCKLFELARNAIGLSLSQNGFASRFFKNGAHTGGILMLPPGMPADVKDSYDKEFQNRYAGKDRQFTTMVIRDGAKFQATTIDPAKSQLQELREEQIREVARVLQLPPAELGIKDSVSYNSAEQSRLNYLVTTLLHRLSEITHECRLKLLTREERKDRKRYFDHVVEKLLQTDVKTTNEVLAIQRSSKVINANEWRRVINRNGIGAEGEKYENPNTSSDKPAGESAAAEQDPREPDDGNENAPAVADPGVSENTRRAIRNVLTADVQRFTRRIESKAEGLTKDRAKLVEWIDGGMKDMLPLGHQILRCSVDLLQASRDEHDGEQLDRLVTDIVAAYRRSYDDAISDAGRYVEGMGFRLDIAATVAELTN